MEKLTLEQFKTALQKRFNVPDLWVVGDDISLKTLYPKLAGQYLRSAEYSAEHNGTPKVWVVINYPTREKFTEAGFNALCQSIAPGTPSIRKEIGQPYYAWSIENGTEISCMPSLCRSGYWKLEFFFEPVATAEDLDRCLALIPKI